MADVHWIKLSTDLFDNRKIKYLRKMPEGNSLVLLWVMLLTIAGRCNAGGSIFLTEDIPYTPKMLADELDMEENTVLLALSFFEKLGMIEQEGGYILLTGWEKHQSTDRLAEIREYNRLAKQKSREKQQLLSAVNDMSMTCQSCQGTDTDTDIDTDIEEDTETEERKEEREEKTPGEKPDAKRAKQFVPPTVEEVRAYCAERKNSVDPLRFWEYFDTGGWKDSEGKPVRNWKQKLITWETHSKERGEKSHDSTADHQNVAPQWNIRYSLDGRTL